jgi:hypothetical protein
LFFWGEFRVYFARLAQSCGVAIPLESPQALSLCESVVMVSGLAAFNHFLGSHASVSGVLRESFICILLG